MTQSSRLYAYLVTHPGASCAVCGREFATPGQRGRHETLAHPDWHPTTEFKSARMQESRERYALRQSRSVAFLRNCNIRARQAGRPLIDLALVLPEGPCSYCGSRSDTWDHIVPFGQGGETTPGNLTPVCHPCNRRKSRYGVESAMFRGPFLCGWCWMPLHRSRSKAVRRGRPIEWFSCSTAHSNLLNRWGGRAFGDPQFAGPRTRLVAA